MNEQNLLKGNPNTQIKSGREAVEMGRKGGIQNGINAKARKTAKQIAELMLSSTLIGDEYTYIKTKYQNIIDEEDINVMAMIIAGQIQASKKGNPKAFENVLALIGQGIYEQKQEENNGILEQLSEYLAKGGK